MIKWKHSVYLAGPISGLDYVECTWWRNHAVEKLAEHNIRGLSPMRCKENLANTGILGQHERDYIHYNPLSTNRGIMTRDHFDATRCDLLLVNFVGAPKASLGTAMEIAWAWHEKIPVVMAMEDEGNVHDHAMITEAVGFRLNNIDDAINLVIKIL
jgi:nucleoside 2-deoxyribosyltransferase